MHTVTNSAYTAAMAADSVAEQMPVVVPTSTTTIAPTIASFFLPFFFGAGASSAAPGSVVISSFSSLTARSFLVRQRNVYAAEDMPRRASASSSISVPLSRQ